MTRLLTVHLPLLIGLAAIVAIPAYAIGKPLFWLVDLVTYARQLRRERVPGHLFRRLGVAIAVRRRVRQIAREEA